LVDRRTTDKQVDQLEEIFFLLRFDSRPTRLENKSSLSVGRSVLAKEEEGKKTSVVALETDRQIDRLHTSEG
jgi:hypothetical protein